MRDIYLDTDVTNLSDDNCVISRLKENGVNKIRDIWVLKKSDLKQFGLSGSQINSIIIKLQLNGLDINSKVYNKM